jgi:hypothetical protein
VETMQGINLPSPEGPLLAENFSDRCAKSCGFLATFSAMGAAFLAPPTLHSDRRQFSAEIGRGDKLNKPTCLESVKIPGRYQASIMPCMSTIMHGMETVTPFSGLYRRLMILPFYLMPWFLTLKNFPAAIPHNM